MLWGLRLVGYAVALWVQARHWQLWNSCSPSRWNIPYVYTWGDGWKSTESGITCTCVKMFGFGKLLPQSSAIVGWQSTSTADLNDSTSTSTPCVRSSVFQPVTCRILKQPCAPANGTKTKHFARLIASVCTSRPKWAPRDQRRTGHAWDGV